MARTSVLVALILTLSLAQVCVLGEKNMYEEEEGSGKLEPSPAITTGEHPDTNPTIVNEREEEETSKEEEANKEETVEKGEAAEKELVTAEEGVAEEEATAEDGALEEVTTTTEEITENEEEAVEEEVAGEEEGAAEEIVDEETEEVEDKEDELNPKLILPFNARFSLDEIPDRYKKPLHYWRSNGKCLCSTMARKAGICSC